MLKTLSQKFSIPVSNTEMFDHCNSCSSDKSHEHPFSENSLVSEKPLQIIFSDVWGPSHVLSIDKKLYYVIFVDQFTKYIWLYTLKNKSEVKTIFSKFKPLVENYFHTKILSIYTDGCGEFEGLKSFLHTNGIEHLVSPSYTPQRVAMAEHRH